MAYGSSTIIATCKAGQKFEKGKIGYCFDDIKAMISGQENAPLTLPPTMNSDDAIYWINRTQEIFPGQDIKIQVGE
jgi:hypothetical protein